jgi:glucose-6-phosphate dehydrogenase assembly protein OpcA
LLAGRTGICVLRCLLKKRQVPDYLCNKYIITKQSSCKIGEDIESNKKKKIEHNLVLVVDKEVVEYSRVSY